MLSNTGFGIAYFSTLCTWIANLHKQGAALRLLTKRKWVLCQYFSMSDRFWRRFFAPLALCSTKDGKWAYFEWQLVISWLERGILRSLVKKVQG